MKMYLNINKFRLVIAKNQCTMAELSAKCGVSQTTLCRIVNGKQTARPKTIGRIAAALGVDVTEIIDMGGESK